MRFLHQKLKWIYNNSNYYRQSDFVILQQVRKKPKQNKEFTAWLLWQAGFQPSSGNPSSAMCHGDLERPIRILFQHSNHPHGLENPPLLPQPFVRILAGSHASCTALLQQSKRENSTFERREPITPWIFDRLCKHSEHSIAINKLLCKSCT